MPLSLTLAPIADGQNADASDVLVPFNQTQTFANGLETSLNDEIANRTAAITNLKNGADSFNQLNLGTPPTALQIIDNTITITRSFHVIDTEGGAASDDLAAINGGAAGDVLYLRIESTSRPITVKHGLGGIFTYSGADVVLNRSSMLAHFVFDPTLTGWLLVSAGVSTLLLHGLSTPASQTPVTLLGLPDRVLVNNGQLRLDVSPGLMASNRVSVRASGATIQGDLAAITQAGVVASNNQSDTSYSSMTTGTAVGNNSSWASTFDVTRRAYDPMIEMLIMMPSLLTLGRWFFGFFSQAPTNADNPAGSVIGLRYLAGDAGFKGICDDGTTLGVTSVLANVDPDTAYRLRVRVDGSGGGVAYFSVNGGAEVPLSTGMPGAGTNLGFGMYVYTDTTAARAVSFGRAVATWK